jgi:hypothetical protein
MVKPNESRDKKKLKQQFSDLNQTELKKRGTVHMSNKNQFFSFRNKKSTTDLRRSPPSLPHLISAMKNEFLAQFYSKNYEMKLGSGTEPHPL